LSFSIVKYKNISATSNDSDDIKFNRTKNIIVNDCYQAVLDNSEAQQFHYYTIEQGDTLFKIAKKYNSNLSAIINANTNTIPNPNYLKIGQQLKVPALEMRNILRKDELVSFTKSKITFDETSKTISIDGKGSIVALPDIFNALNNESILEKLNDKKWLLKANLLVKKGVTLVIDDSNVSWLKLKSDKDEFVWLQSNSGNILISNTKITSWDEESQAPDTDYALRSLKQTACPNNQHLKQHFYRKFPTFDFVKTSSDRKSTHTKRTINFLFGKIPSSDYYCWEKPVLSPVSGKVIRSSDGWKDHAYTNLWKTIVIWYNATYKFRPRERNGRLDIRPNAGNHVMIETDDGYTFQYDSEFLKRNISISVSLPLRKEPYQSDELFPFFKGLLPEGWYLGIVSATQKIDSGNFFGILSSTASVGTIGAVTIRKAE